MQKLNRGCLMATPCMLISHAPAREPMIQTCREGDCLRMNHLLAKSAQTGASTALQQTRPQHHSTADRNTTKCSRATQQAPTLLFLKTQRCWDNRNSPRNTLQLQSCCARFSAQAGSLALYLTIHRAMACLAKKSSRNSAPAFVGIHG